MQLQHPEEPLNRAAANAALARRWLLISCALAIVCCQPCLAAQVGAPANAAVQDGDADRAAKLKQAAAFKKQAEVRRSEGKLAEAGDALVNLGNVYWQLGDFPAARKQYEESLTVYRTMAVKDDLRIAASLYNLGLVLRHLGDLVAARKHHDDALAIRRSKLPKDDPRIADSLQILGIVLHDLGDLVAARRHHEDALAILRSKLPKDHPRIADGLNNLGIVLRDLGELAAARKHYEDALAIYRNKLPKDDLHIAVNLNNLGLVLRDLGELAAARKHLDDALAIYRSKAAKDDLRTASSLNNLGIVLSDLGELAAARERYEAALAIRRSKLPKDDPRIAESLDNLGLVLRDLGDLAAARKYHGEAMAIFRSKLSKDDPRLAASLNNLGNLLRAAGELNTARKHLEDALTIRRSKLPKDHPELRYPLFNLMLLEQGAGNREKSVAYLEEMTYLELTRQERDGLVRSEREQLSRAARSRPALDRLFHELLRAARFERAYDLTVAAKGAVTARQRWLRLQRDVADERTAKLLEELRSLDGQLLQTGLSGVDRVKPASLDVGDRLQTLSRRRDELERELIAASPAFVAATQRARRGLKEITAALPAEAALIDFVEYVPVTLDVKNGEEKTEAPRLGAFVVRPGSKLEWVDLGQSKDMEESVNAWRTSYGTDSKLAKVANPGAELRKALWERLEPHVAGAKLILVAPEGPLNGLPFGALPGKKAGSYLLEEYAFANVPTPQLLPDLLEKTEPRFERPLAMLLVGDVDFGAPGTPFQRLVNTRTEINDIQAMFHRRLRDGKVVDLREEDATKAAFVAAAGEARYLHVATHGFFADPSQKSALAIEQRAAALRSSRFMEARVVGEHPGLLSGIAFAGANQKEKKAEAILTALEVSEMELRGVELVVLSACETGLGRVAGGEGVLGLQRGLQVAGARTTVTSLWKVPDAQTQQLMSRFYENLWKNKLSKVEALREAQLWMMREGNVRGLGLPAETKTLPPQYWWAAFVLSGDWR